MITAQSLHREDLTTKDKLVVLAYLHSGLNSAAEIAAYVGLSTPSVKASLEKAELLDPEVEKTLHTEIVDAIIEACSIDRRSMRDKDWKHITSVASELVSAGASSEEVRVRARNLRLRLRLPITPGSIDKYWPQLADQSVGAPSRVLA